MKIYKRDIKKLFATGKIEEIKIGDVLVFVYLDKDKTFEIADNKVGTDGLIYSVSSHPNGEMICLSLCTGKIIEIKKNGWLKWKGIRW